MASDRMISPRVFERFGLLKPEPSLIPDKTLFVEKCPEGFPPNLVAHHVLRAAVQNGCAKISVRRGRWRYEFRVEDLMPKKQLVQTVANRGLEALGPSALKLKLAGCDQDTVKGPEQQVLVRPPWKQTEEFGEKEKDNG